MAVARRSLAAFPRQWNPTQVPTWPVEIDWNKAPPGLSFCLLFGVNGLIDLVAGKVPVVNGTPSIGQSPMGPALNTSAGFLAYSMPASGVFTLEAWFTIPNAGGGVVGWDNNSSASSGVYDHAIGTYIGNLDAYIYSSGAVHASGTPLSAYSLYHAVATNDGTDLRLYMNGALAATAAAGLAYTGYTTPYLIVGKNALSGAWPGDVIAVAAATAPWTADQVAARFRAPFAMLRPIVRRTWSVPAGGSSYTVSLSASQATGGTLLKLPARLISVAAPQGAALARIAGRRWGVNAPQAPSVGINPGIALSMAQPKNFPPQSRQVGRSAQAVMPDLAALARAAARLFSANAPASVSNLISGPRQFSLGQAQTVVRVLAAARSFNAGATQTAAMMRAVRRGLGAATAYAAKTVASVRRSHASVQATQAAITRSVIRLLAVAQAASTVFLRPGVLALSAAVSLAATISRRLVRLLAAAQPQAIVRMLAVARSFGAAAAASAAAVVARPTTLVVSAVQSHSSLFTRSAARSLSAAQTAAGTVLRAVARAFGMGVATLAQAILPGRATPRRVLRLPPDLRTLRLPADRRWWQLPRDR